MAILLVRTVNGENAQRYMDGDVVTVLPDGHVFGRMESLRVWVSEGRKAEDWPGGFAIVDAPALSAADARAYRAEGVNRRRDVKIDYRSLERREGERETLNSQAFIHRPDVIPGLLRK